MAASAEEVQRFTAEKVGDGGDYSYITDEVLAAITESDAQPKDEGRSGADSAEAAVVEENVNTLTYQNGRYYHRNECETNKWWYVTQLSSSTRIVNCTNGLIRHRIRY